MARHLRSASRGVRASARGCLRRHAAPASKPANSCGPPGAVLDRHHPQRAELPSTGMAPGGGQARRRTPSRASPTLSLVRLIRATGDFTSRGSPRNGRPRPTAWTFTLTLRDGVTFSDGVAVHVGRCGVFFPGALRPRVKSSLASSVMVQGKPLAGRRGHFWRTVVIPLPAPFAPGVALLDSSRSTRSTSSRLRSTRTPSPTPGAPRPRGRGTMAGLGPFVVGRARHRVSGSRWTRNPRYWQKDAAGVQLPVPRFDRLRVRGEPGRRGPAASKRDRSISWRTPTSVRRTSPRCASSAIRARAARRRRRQRRPERALVQPHARRQGFSGRPSRIWREPSSARRSRTRSIATQSSAPCISAPPSPSMARSRRATARGIPPPRRRIRTTRRARRRSSPASGWTDRNGDGMLEDAAGRAVQSR